ncbi:MAG: hypothetical protein HS111_05935 [Kofleriaceae bacterium]|nr:hypothetical protein [Kofleriaceae bacterium]
MAVTRAAAPPVVSAALASTVTASGSIDGTSPPGSHTPRRSASQRSPPSGRLAASHSRGSPTKPSSGMAPVWRS